MAASLFRYRNGQLFCEEVPLHHIATAVGTPAYVYSLGGVQANFRQIRSAFAPPESLVCYALKANANCDLVRRLAEEGSGADIVSGGELAIALYAGVPPERIVFAGVGKTEQEIRFALQAGVLALNVESIQELELIEQVAGSLGTRAPVSLRLNPNVDIHGHPYLSTGRRFDKFGIGLDQIDSAVAQVKRSPALEFVGFHCHLGSQIGSPDPYLTVLDVLLDLIRKHSPDVPLRHLDIGGGIGVNYDVSLEAEGECLAFDPSDLASEVLARTAGLAEKVVVEPGRSVVANAGALICRVLYTKRTGGRRFVIVDAAMNDFLRPALYGARHRVLPLEAREGAAEVCDVVGPVCESGDFLARDVELPPLDRGDYLAIMGVGAYGYVLASNYNARPRPPEVIVEGSEYRISRPREEQVWEVSLPPASSRGR